MAILFTILSALCAVHSRLVDGDDRRDSMLVAIMFALWEVAARI